MGWRWYSPVFGILNIKNDSEYHFITHWSIRGPIGVVFEILRDGAGYSRWWGPAYRITEEVGPKLIRSVVRARLPYTLEFTSQLVREDPPYELEIHATGELEGRGHWRLSQVGFLTEVVFHWDVRAHKPLIRWFSFLLKPLFRWNHDWVMHLGEKRLQAEVDRRIDSPRGD